MSFPRFPKGYWDSELGQAMLKRLKKRKQEGVRLRELAETAGLSYGALADILKKYSQK